VKRLYHVSALPSTLHRGMHSTSLAQELWGVQRVGKMKILIRSRQRQVLGDFMNPP
jgi:hypothetical protein